MTRQTLIKKTIDNISRLPDQKLLEVLDFAEYLLSKIDDKIITKGIQNFTMNSKAFKFLEDEEDLYTRDDLKEIYK